MSENTSPGDLANEAALIARAQAGDEAAVETLLAAHQDRVFRTALSLSGGDEEAAREIAQDVLISAYRHLAQFRGESRFSTWLYRMTVNFSKNRHVAEGRRARRFTSLDSLGPARNDEAPRPYDAPDTQPSPRTLAAGRQLLQLLFERLHLLPEEFHAVLHLRYVEDRPYEEIADLLAIPLGTVKSRINRGRRELRKLAADLLEEDGDG